MDEQVGDAMRGERRGITREGGREKQRRTKKNEEDTIDRRQLPFQKFHFKNNLFQMCYIVSIYKEQ